VYILQRVLRVVGVCAVIGVAVLSACDIDNPDRLIRAPVIRSYSPTSVNVDALVGDTLSFSISAVDPDLGDLKFFFTMSDSMVSDSSAWNYVVNDTGAVMVAGHATNGQRESTVRWIVTRIEPENEPPEILSWRPIEPRPRIIIGSSIEFTIQARDPEGEPLTYIYTVNDTVRASSFRYTFQPGYIGTFDVKAVVSDGERFAIHSWDLFVSAEPDSILPAPVTITRLEPGAQAGELAIEWVAVGDDGTEGIASNYEVRTSSIPIDTEEAWNNASERVGAPTPAPAGTVEHMVIHDLKPADVVYVAVRAVDDFGNISPLGNTLSALVKGMEVYGTIRDALTNEPLPGIRVALFDNVDVTGADGRYALTRLPRDVSAIRVTDESDPGTIGAYFDINRTGYQVVDHDVLDFWMVPNVTLETQEYADMLTFLRFLTNTTSYTLGTLMPTWELPCSAYVAPYSRDGIDYDVLIKEQLDMWENLTGIDFWVEVDHIPTVGFYTIYQSNISRDYYEGLISEPPGLPILGRIHFRTVYDPSTAQSLKTIAAHELGHVLGMAHSSDEGHLMIGGRASAVTQPTLDEIWLARIMYHIPRGTDLLWYVWN